MQVIGRRRIHETAASISYKNSNKQFTTLLKALPFKNFVKLNKYKLLLKKH